MRVVSGRVCVCVCLCVYVCMCGVCGMCGCLGDGAEAMYRTLYSAVLVSNKRSMMSQTHQARKQSLPLFMY